MTRLVWVLGRADVDHGLRQRPTGRPAPLPILANARDDYNPIKPNLIRIGMDET